MALELLSHWPLAELTSWKVGGAAENFCQPQSQSELREALALGLERQWPVTILGGGSNVLVADAGVRGLVISTQALTSLAHYTQAVDTGSNWPLSPSGSRFVVEAECGVAKSELLKLFLKAQLSPALFLSGLPGDVSGGVVMNAGVSTAVSPKEFGEIVDWVEVLDSTLPGIPLRRVERSQLSWSYRKSLGWQPGVISRVGLSWPLVEDEQVMDGVRELTLRRRQTQPLNFPSCGSVFRNPNLQRAGQLIDQCGLKGFQVGGAQISEKHANFIINRGQATALDILTLIEHVKKCVHEKVGVLLETEVVYIGSFS